MQRSIWWRFVIVIAVIAVVGPVWAQTTPFPPLTETFEGRGRLADVSFKYPQGWHTLDGIPVNRLISFNVISSVPVGLRNSVEPGEEAVVMAIAGVRVDRWGAIEADDTPNDMLTVFFEQLGDDDQFGGGEEAEQAGPLEEVIETLDIGGYDVVLRRYIPAEDAASPDANDESDSSADSFNGDFAVYGLLLDDSRFVVVLLLTSEVAFDDIRGDIEAMLGTIAYTG